MDTKINKGLANSCLKAGVLTTLIFAGAKTNSQEEVLIYEANQDSLKYFISEII